MSKAYSEDFRIRVIRYVEGGASICAAARRFEIGVATVGRWFRQWRRNGMAAAGPRGHPGGSKLDAHADFLLDLFKKTPGHSFALAILTAGGNALSKKT